MKSTESWAYQKALIQSNILGILGQGDFARSWRLYGKVKTSVVGGS